MEITLINYSTSDAITAIQYALQNCDEGEFQFNKKKFDVESLEWFGTLISFTWPRSYKEILQKFNGFSIGNTHVYSFIESIEILRTFREKFKNEQYWPIGTDGCGNYYVLNTAKLEHEECPVFFLEADSDYSASNESFSSFESYVVLSLNFDLQHQ